MKKRSITSVVLVGGILVLLLFAVPHAVHAQMIEKIASSVVTTLASGIGYIIAYIGAVLIAFASACLQFAAGLNQNVLSVTLNPIVGIGWDVVRDVANLGFVLVIIIVAIGTMLRLPSYQAKKLLPRLIAAAIIVNFSFAIASVFVNFGNTLGSFFLSRATGNGAFSIANTIVGAFNPQKFMLQIDQQSGNPIPPNPEVEQGGLTTFSAATLVSIASIIFVAVFSFLMAFVLLAMALMFIMRFLHITFLVIISPIIWLFWVIPPLSTQFNKWWNSFLKWVFFAPTASFFIYLSLISLQRMNAVGSTFLQGIPVSVFSVFGSTLGGVLILGLQMIVIGGLLVGGIIVAQSMGIAGAAGAMSILNKTKGSVQAWAGRKGRQAATAPLRVDTGKKVTDWMQAEGKGSFGKLIHNPLTQQIGAVASRFAATGEKLPSQAKSRVDAFGSDARAAKAYHTLDAPGKIALVEKLTKNNSMNLLPQSAKEDLLKDEQSRKLFERYDKKKAFGDAEKGLGINVETYQAIQGNKSTRETALKEKEDIKKRGGEEGGEIGRRWSQAKEEEKKAAEEGRLDEALDARKRADSYAEQGGAGLKDRADAFEKAEEAQRNAERPAVEAFQKWHSTWKPDDYAKFPVNDIYGEKVVDKGKPTERTEYSHGLDPETVRMLREVSVQGAAANNVGSLRPLLRNAKAENFDRVARSIDNLVYILRRGTRDEQSRADQILSMQKSALAWRSLGIEQPLKTEAAEDTGGAGAPPAPAAGGGGGAPKP